jgi:hypothetical protein
MVGFVLGLFDFREMTITSNRHNNRKICTRWWHLLDANSSRKELPQNYHATPHPYTTATFGVRLALRLFEKSNNDVTTSTVSNQLLHVPSTAWARESLL